MHCLDYELVLGVPGSGKTSLISVTLQLFAREKKRVFITTHTNSALDNILLRLDAAGVKFMRIASSEDAVHPTIRPYMSSKLVPFEGKSSYTEFKNLLENTYIYAATVYGVVTDVLRIMHFDFCIVDEASQIVEPACIAPLLSCNKFILIGDYHQLNPIIQWPKGKEEQLDISLFERLGKLHPEALTVLRKQYRMNKDIMGISNDIVYRGLMEAGADWVLKRQLPLNINTSGLEWLKNTCDPAQSVVFVDTDKALDELKPEKRENIRRRNKYECWIIFHLVEELLARGLSERKVGIITPYVEQFKALRFVISQPLLDIYTIDKSQGIDKECIIVSCVKNRSQAELLRDIRRINVAFTRAQSKLIIVGSLQTMLQVPTMSGYVEHVRSHDWVISLPSIVDEKRFFLSHCSRASRSVHYKSTSSWKMK